VIVIYIIIGLFAACIGFGLIVKLVSAAFDGGGARGGVLVIGIVISIAMIVGIHLTM